MCHNIACKSINKSFLTPFSTKLIKKWGITCIEVSCSFRASSFPFPNRSVVEHDENSELHFFSAFFVGREQLHS